jgi:uncharacterized protein with gpF-like domain
MSNSFHDIFNKYLPMWRSAVSKYARNIWYGIDDEESNNIYDNKAIHFSRQYRHALEKYYAERNMKVYHGTLDGTVWEWLKKQQALKDTLKVIAQDKKNILVENEIEKLKKTKDAQAMIDKLYDAKKGETIYKVFSFKDNLKALAEQRGEEESYSLGTDVSQKIIQHFSDRYFWRTQKDRKVRNVDRQLEGLCFQFADPPTCVSKYGKRQIGNPGIKPGCRCWSDIAPKKEKALKNYVVHEK